MTSLRVRGLRSTICIAICVALSAGSAGAQTPTAVPAPQAAAPSTAYTIAGTLVDQQGLLPIAGAQLILEQGGQTVSQTISDPQGRFSFPPQRPGIYNILVRASGYQITRSDDIVLGGGNATVSLALSRAAANTSNSLKTIARVSARAATLQTTTTIQQQVDPELLERTGSLRAAEGLGQLPGVNLIGLDSAVGDDISVDIRGLKPSETQVLLDGHPIGPVGVYPASIGGGTGGYDYQDAPLFALQNIVVTYGSGATGLYGVDAVGGAVDFQTINPSSRLQGTVKYGFGQLGTQTSAFQLTGTTNKWAYVLLHGVVGSYGNFPGQIIAQTGARGNDFTSSTLQNVTYFVSGDYLLRNDLGKLQYNFSPSTALTLTTYVAASRDDKTGEGDNDYITYDFSRYHAQQSPNCTTGAGAPGVTVVTNSGNACFTPAQYAQNANGPAGGGPGAFQALLNQDYHARFTTVAGKNQIVLDSYVDNYSQNRERPDSFLNGPTSILNVDYRSMGTLISDDIASSKNDFGFGYNTLRQYTNGQNVQGSVVLTHSPVFNRLNSIFLRDVFQASPKLSFAANAWLKDSNVGGNSFDPRLSIIFKVTPNDVIRLTGGKSSADPAPLPLQLTGPGGINPGNCKQFSIGEAQSPTEVPERASDLEVSYAHRFMADTSVQMVAYDTNVIDSIFVGQEPAADFQSILNQVGPNYLAQVFSRIQTICPNFAAPNPPPTLANLFLATNLNLAKQRARGLELSSRIRLSSHAFVEGYWDLQSSAIFDAPVSLLQSNVNLINGSQLPRIPLHKIGVSFDITNNHGAEVYMNYTHVDSNNELNRPAYGIATAALTQTLNKDLSLSFGINNFLGSSVDNYGRIGLGVYVPENIFGTDRNALAQGSERFGLAPATVLLSLTQKI